MEPFDRPLAPDRNSSPEPVDNSIGLALSGGGVRAIGFHLGVIEWVAKSPLWPSVAHLSTVSGGSLAIALFLSGAEYTWPPADRVGNIVNEIGELLCRKSVQTRFIANHFRRPWIARRGRAALLADAIARTWDIRASLADLPQIPEWWINTTSYETGRNWRFSKGEMGDWVRGYFAKPNVRIADAVAASAAVPFLIGSLKLALPPKPSRTSGYKMPPGYDQIANARAISLWDGGVYENLGIEKLFKVSDFARPDLSFLLVSDAGAPLAARENRWSAFPPFYMPFQRFTDIAADQARAYRTRAFIRFLSQNQKAGIYVKIGNSPSYVFGEAGKETPATYPADVEDAISRVWLMNTSLKRLTSDKFSDLRRHGYWTARATYEAWAA